MANRIFTKNEESGFGDPLTGNDDNFDILQYIGASDTPEGSPAAFCNAAGHVIYQQQQQLISAAELVQALAPGPRQLQKDPTHSQQQQHAMDNVGLMYNNNGGSIGPRGPLGMGPMLVRGGGGGRGQTRLPDSPPITDVSGGGSSISPGSSGGCCDSSPFSPDHYQQYGGGHHHTNGGGVLLMPQPQHPREDMLLVNQMGQMMGQQRVLRDECPGSGGTECVHSPNSEFLSPYPPSQSTPGSQHSSQISPPAISHHQKGLSYLLQCQQQQQPSNMPISVAGSFASMDNIASFVDAGTNGNGESDGLCQQHQPIIQQPHGQKRRRMSSSAAPGSNESLPMGNSTNLPNIKSEICTTQMGGESVRGANANSVSPQHNNLAEQQQRMLLQQAQQQSFDEMDENVNNQKTIKFEPYLRESWNMCYDINQQPLPPMPIAVVADKGFNYSPSDNCFVNQKKNHFQITLNIGVDMAVASSLAASATPPTLSMSDGLPQSSPSPFTPRYVRVQGTLQPILDNEFYLLFCGVKSEMQTSEIKIKQSQADRKPIDHTAESFTIDGTRPSVRQTVARLHFGETTMNNHRKNGKPNPEQKFFLLVVKLLAKTPVGPVLVQAFHSDRVIVRASNPGQFEQPDQELNWQRGYNGSLAFAGQVCIGTDKPIGDANLTVHGNIATTGNVTRPSDRRVKEDIADLSTTEAMSRVAQMRLVEFAYKPEIAQKWGLSEQDRHRVGVIAQELADVLPDAVKDNGEFLTVDDTRVFYDTVAAAQELYRLTGNLESKIDQVEKISQKLARYAQKRRQLGSMASGLSDFSTFFGPKSGLADKQSCVSYSRTSLTSAGTTAANNNDEDDDRARDNRKRRGGGKAPASSHYRCRSHSSASAYCNRSPYYGGGSDSALCNSKVTQGTIVTLVAVMAICLVTMCTLYVMDWYNRTYVLPMHPPPHNPSVPQPMGKYFEEVPKWTLPKQQHVSPLTAFCSSSFSALVAVPFSPGCPQYCCSDKYSYEHFGDKLSTGVDMLVALASKATEHILPPPPQQLFKEAHLAGALGAFPNGVKIEVLSMNVSIGADFCVEGSCDGRKGRFDLYVPISEHLPTVPVQLRISTEDPTLFVDGCSSVPGFPHRSCQLKNKLQSLEEETARKQPSSIRVAENIFELSAGSFLQSAYRFRIGHSTNLCQQEDKQRGRMFDEYNLVFYRTCATNPNEVQQDQQGKEVADGPSDGQTTLLPTTTVSD